MATVFVAAVLTVTLELHSYGRRPDTQSVISLVATAGRARKILAYRYLTATKRAQLELSRWIAITFATITDSRRA